MATRANLLSGTNPMLVRDGPGPVPFFTIWVQAYIDEVGERRDILVLVRMVWSHKNPAQFQALSPKIVLRQRHRNKPTKEKCDVTELGDKPTKNVPVRNKKYKDSLQEFSPAQTKCHVRILGENFFFCDDSARLQALKTCIHQQSFR